jgi:hypothetical protein
MAQKTDSQERLNNRIEVLRRMLMVRWEGPFTSDQIRCYRGVGPKLARELERQGLLVKRGSKQTPLRAFLLWTLRDKFTSAQARECCRGILNRWDGREMAGGVDPRLIQDMAAAYSGSSLDIDVMIHRLDPCNASLLMDMATAPPSEIRVFKHPRGSMKLTHSAPSDIVFDPSESPLVVAKNWLSFFHIRLWPPCVRAERFIAIKGRLCRLTFAFAFWDGDEKDYSFNLSLTPIAADGWAVSPWLS